MELHKLESKWFQFFNFWVLKKGSRFVKITNNKDGYILIKDGKNATRWHTWWFAVRWANRLNFYPTISKQMNVNRRIFDIEMPLIADFSGRQNLVMLFDLVFARHSFNHHLSGYFETILPKMPLDPINLLIPFWERKWRKVLGNFDIPKAGHFIHLLLEIN